MLVTDVMLRQSEFASHYFHAPLPHRFDLILHYDETRAVEPLERNAAWKVREVAETYPSGRYEWIGDKQPDRRRTAMAKKKAVKKTKKQAKKSEKEQPTK